MEQRLKMENPSFYCLLSAEVVIIIELWTQNISKGQIITMTEVMRSNH